MIQFVTSGPVVGGVCAAVVGFGCISGMTYLAGTGVFAYFNAPLAGYCLEGLGNCALIGMAPTL